MRDKFNQLPDYYKPELKYKNVVPTQNRNQIPSEKKENLK